MKRYQFQKWLNIALLLLEYTLVLGQNFRLNPDYFFVDNQHFTLLPLSQAAKLVSVGLAAGLKLLST